MSNFSDYDSFAWFYNRYWGTDFARSAMAIYEIVLFPHLSADAKLLDLCCGTGQLAAALSERGFQVTGVDGSVAMLDCARANAREVEFIQSDIRALALPPTSFDTVISAFDSLNHLMSLDELKQVFRRVHGVLRKGGIFLFDLNLETDEDARPHTLDVVEDDHACIVQATYDREQRLKEYQVTMFRLQGRLWKRSDLLLQQRYYDEAIVIGALAEAGFQRVKTYDARREFGLTLSDGRMFFLARKLD
jgi:SAM-dependent methyltransferase